MTRYIPPIVCTFYVVNLAFFLTTYLPLNANIFCEGSPTVFSLLSNFQSFIFYINAFLIFIGIRSSGASEWIWLFMTYIFLAMVYKFTIIYCSKICWTCGIADAMDQSWLGKSPYFWLIWKDRWSHRGKLIEFYLNLSEYLILSSNPSTKWFGLAVFTSDCFCQRHQSNQFLENMLGSDLSKP